MSGLKKEILIKFHNCEIPTFPTNELIWTVVYKELRKLCLKDNAQFCFISCSTCIRGIFVKIQFIGTSHVSCKRCICGCDRSVF